MGLGASGGPGGPSLALCVPCQSSLSPCTASLHPHQPLGGAGSTTGGFMVGEEGQCFVEFFTSFN